MRLIDAINQAGFSANVEICVKEVNGSESIFIWAPEKDPIWDLLIDQGWVKSEEITPSYDPAGCCVNVIDDGNGPTWPPTKPAKENAFLAGVVLAEWDEAVPVEEDQQTGRLYGPRPDKKTIDLIKTNVIRSIEWDLSTEAGYETQISSFSDTLDDGSDDDVVWIRHQIVAFKKGATKYIPSAWKAGIDGPIDFEIGEDITWEDFVSEEAKRKIRDMFPGYESFVTWAWYN